MHSSSSGLPTLLLPKYRGKRIPGPPNGWLGYIWQIRQMRAANIWYLESKKLFAEYGKIVGFRVFCKFMRALCVW